MVSGEVGFGAPTAVRSIGALEGVMAKLLAVGTLGEAVEVEVTLHTEGGGKGRQAWQRGQILGPGASKGDDGSGNAFGGATVVRGKPPGLPGEGEARVEGGEFSADVGKRM